jgi:hypothetical protein
MEYHSRIRRRRRDCPAVVMVRVNEKQNDDESVINYIVFAFPFGLIVHLAFTNFAVNRF